MPKRISQEYLKECLLYNEKTGVFYWRERPLSHFKTEKSCKAWNSLRSGTKAGFLCKTDRMRTGYWSISICNSDYRAHVLAWIYAYGDYPSGEIDHIDHDGLNNKIENLRDVSRSVNLKNKRLQKNNTSGRVGVTWYKAYCKWVAKIRSNRKYITLGYYNDFSDAVKAREDAEAKLGFHKNHGSK